MALNDKQTAFVEEYLKCFNATQAALSAGYSAKTARAQGARLLTNVDIAQAVKERLCETAMNADEVLMRLAAIARGDIGDLLTVRNGNIEVDLQKAVDANKTGLIKKLTQRRTSRNVGESMIDDVTVTVELHDPLTALQLLGKNHKLFVEKAEVSGPNGGPIEYKDADEASKRILGRIDRIAARIRADSGNQRDSTDETGANGA